MNSSFSILAILDPFSSYSFKKDTSHLILLALAQRGHVIYYTDPSLVFFKSGQVFFRVQRVSVLSTEPYFSFFKEEVFTADRFDLIWIRKDPPVDLAYLHMTRFLSLAGSKTLVLNSPQALRDWNEKLLILSFPQSIPPTLVSSHTGEIQSFIRSFPEVIVKPLEGFAGKGIQKLSQHAGLHEIEKITHRQTQPVMIQEYLPEVSEGEKRVFIFDGKPWSALLRDQEATLAVSRLTDTEKKLCEEIGVFLKGKGVFFAGVDLIGGKLTEINITSPGLVHEWNQVDPANHQNDIAKLLEEKIRQK